MELGVIAKAVDSIILYCDNSGAVCKTPTLLNVIIVVIELI